MCVCVCIYIYIHVNWKAEEVTAILLMLDEIPWHHWSQKYKLSNFFNYKTIQSDVISKPTYWRMKLKLGRLIACFVLWCINSFQVIQRSIKFQAIQFSTGIVFVYTQLNVKTVLFQTIRQRSSWCILQPSWLGKKLILGFCLKTQCEYLSIISNLYWIILIFLSLLSHLHFIWWGNGRLTL